MLGTSYLMIFNKWDGPYVEYLLHLGDSHKLVLYNQFSYLQVTLFASHVVGDIALLTTSWAHHLSSHISSRLLSLPLHCLTTLFFPFNLAEHIHPHPNLLVYQLKFTISLWSFSHKTLPGFAQLHNIPCAP
ncbi:hypothetical protein O6H91_Y089700 [Diphasiastrum complanatum]|nr:hypothetical protein O6H91_Y089700 [Diphasiastrum complanatum]